MNQPLIVLNFSEMKKGSEMDTVAHEIAHFVLKQESGGKKSEKEADDLSEKWGFKRCYKSYDDFSG